MSEEKLKHKHDADRQKCKCKSVRLFLGRENKEATKGVAQHQVIIEGVVGEQAEIHHISRLQLEHQSTRHMSGSAIFVVLAQVHEVLAVLEQVNAHVVVVTVVGGSSEADVVHAFNRSSEHACK